MGVEQEIYNDDLFAMKKIENFINGELLEPVSGNYLDNINPAIGELYSLIPDSDERDVELAVIAAQEAFPSWSTFMPSGTPSFFPPGSWPKIRPLLSTPSGAAS